MSHTQKHPRPALRSLAAPCIRREAQAGRPVFQIERELALALDRDGISAHYQPQFDAVTLRCCGVEALARWELATGGCVPPSVFISAAERFGMIHDLGNLMLKKACVTAGGWGSTASEPLTLSVNVSTLQIDAAFLDQLESTLQQSGFPAERLELEITESALIVNPERTIEHLNAWKTLGVRIAIDDFGMGYSNLSYLARLPVDRLKIDRSLVHRLTLDFKDIAVVRLILALASELGLDVIAEGVETKQQLQILIDLGCSKVQGYLLGRPVPARLAQFASAKTCSDLLGPSLSEPMPSKDSCPV